ncbi:hypothetical protein HPP92_006912 [Vanilla planifolia]|uniref:Uncharacterized protein n=1 Tax=Vanilla planifolia TaxID=51239 RepID=A0A835RFC5_VANPL|nr:hypothetical protein HPP92_006912 [Vanilla planifolia]
MECGQSGAPFSLAADHMACARSSVPSADSHTTKNLISPSRPAAAWFVAPVIGFCVPAAFNSDRDVGLSFSLGISASSPPRRGLPSQPTHAASEEVCSLRMTDRAQGKGRAVDRQWTRAERRAERAAAVELSIPLLFSVRFVLVGFAVLR